MSGSWDITWNITPEVAWEEIAKRQVDAIEADIKAFIEEMLDPVQQWMKENHRWKNQTGAAEEGLYADIEHIVRTIVYLVMSHGPAVEHAWILEANPRTALLGDAADHWWPVLYRGVVEIVGKHSS